MTLPPSPAVSEIHRDDRAGGTGFTLIELMVVIGIIGVLMAILIPMIGSFQGEAVKTQQLASLQAIAAGLEAYRSDHGDYPRLPRQTGMSNLPETNLGAAVLGKALVGPGPATGAPPAWAAGTSNIGAFVTHSGEEWVCIMNDTTVAPGTTGAAATRWKQVTTTNFKWHDGADGPGARTRQNGAIYPAYLQTDRFTMNGLGIGDRNGFTVLYFPANPADPNIRGANGYVARSHAARYNADDNLHAFRVPTSVAPSVLVNEIVALRRIRAMLGDFSNNGGIEANETPVAVGPYILWATDESGLYTAADIDAASTEANVREMVRRSNAVIYSPQ